MLSRTLRCFCAVKSLFATVLATALLVTSYAHATSVVAVTLEEMLRNSAVVFEGRVSDVQVRESGNHAIQTQVRFEILDVIKGHVPDRSLTLAFLGGEMAGRKLSVSNMHMPQLHERGIYFVESPARTQVHPLYGWSQGHLLLETGSDGIDRVFTRSGRPVRGVEHTDGKRPGGLSTGVARGLLTGDRGETAGAFGSSAFKRLLRAMR
jgi:hypothetical protein